jgi:hypothetical protein
LVIKYQDYFYFFNFFSGDCCKSVKATWQGRKTNSRDLRKTKYGDYELQIGKVNGKVHYISSDGKNAIWYSPSGYWKVGLAKNKATIHSSFFLKSTSDCPTGHAYTWKYANDKKWHKADKGFTIYCTKHIAKKRSDFIGEPF